MTPAQASRDCPVCGHNEAEAYLQKGELRLVRCRHCRMIYANPVPAEFASGEYYDQAGADYYLSPAKLESDYAAVRFERELRLFRRHCQGGAVLDVGCSSGAFLFQLNQRFPGCYQVLGTDVSGPPLDYAESRGVAVRPWQLPGTGFRRQAVRRGDLLGGAGAFGRAAAVPREGLVGAQAGRPLLRAGAEHEVAGSAVTRRTLPLHLPAAPELLHEGHA